MRPEQAVLACTGLSVRFGGVQALSDVDFQVQSGTITTLIGPNGAGKTTLLNAITGLVPLASGRIVFKGQDITRLPPHARGKAGVVRTFQNLEIFSNMSVLENVMTGGHRRVRYSVLDAIVKTPRFFRGERECRKQALRKLDFVGLAALAEMSAAELAFGNQRLLELARAVASEPELLLLDEPAAGLNMKETRALGRLIHRVRDELGITVVLVEHDMDLVMSISDAITVLHFGQELTRGTPQQVQNDPAVIAAYLGDDDDRSEDES